MPCPVSGSSSEDVAASPDHLTGDTTFPDMPRRPKWPLIGQANYQSFSNTGPPDHLTDDTATYASFSLSLSLSLSLSRSLSLSLSLSLLTRRLFLSTLCCVASFSLSLSLLTRRLFLSTLFALSFAFQPTDCSCE
jgi:hypothetical protein